MAPVILVDTDILIDAARKIDAAVQFLNESESEGALGISIITEMELVTGCRDKKELRKLYKFLKRFEALPLHSTMSKEASRLLREYRLSHGLLIPDALIAATAIGNGLTLATKNIRDFRFIEGLNLAEYPAASH